MTNNICKAETSELTRWGDRMFKCFFLEDIRLLGSILQILIFSRQSDALQPSQPCSPKSPLLQSHGPGHAVIIFTCTMRLSWPPAEASYTLTAPGGGLWPVLATEGHQRIAWGES